MLSRLASSNLLRRGAQQVFSRTAQRGIAYQARLKESTFVLNDVLDAPGHYKKEGFTEVTPDVIEGILQECSKLCENVLAPLYEVGDREGCTLLPNTDVQTPKGWKEAYQQYIAGGWQSISVPTDYGGQGLPLSLGLLKAEMLGTANWAFSMYPGLSLGAINTLLLHGTEEMKQTYVSKMSEGTWAGTMCLTEPQCGSDLGQVKTKAIPQADGTYKITGTKIFISCGEHDFTDNIVHIVLARLPDAPAGTKGISLFLVPKYLINADGSLSDKKNVICGGLEKKMGIHGSATCIMNFDDSVGYLIGKPNTGLYQMFTFMNTARIGTAVQGLAASELALQNSVPYARSRLSMRSLSGTKSPNTVADPIIVHPDVRRMLLTQKAFAEGGRAMVYDAAIISDGMINPDKAIRDRVEDDLGLLTPILKGFLTETSLESTSYAMQVYGGHGFIRDNSVEQIYRDARISTLYEGTTGIQGLDLLGRKIMLQKGKPLFRFSKKVFNFASGLVFDSHLGSWSRSLLAAVAKWNYITIRLMASAAKDRDVIGAASVDYLMYSGYVVMGYYWLRIAKAAQKALESKPEDKDFYFTKLHTAQFYFERLLPRASAHAETALASPKTLLKIKEENLLL